MKKKIYLMNFILIIILFSFSVEANEFTRDYEDIPTFEDDIEFLDFIESNLSNIKNAYNDYNPNEVWNIEYIEDIINIKVIGSYLNNYLIVFNEGYMLINKKFELLDYKIVGECPVIDKSSETYFFSGFYYKLENEEYVSNSNDTYEGELDYCDLFDKKICYDYNSNKDEIEIVRSYTTDISTKDGNFGNYDVITGHQTESDCGAQAVLNYLYTLDFSDSAHYVNSYIWDDEITTLHQLMNFPKTSGKFYGIWPYEVRTGTYSYTGIDLHMVLTNLDLCIGLYSNLNMENTAHYALFVGQGRKRSWWFFYTYYDLISTWNANFDRKIVGNNDVGAHNDVTKKDYNCFDNYYFVNHKFALAYYRFGRNDYETKVC